MRQVLSLIFASCVIASIFAACLEPGDRPDGTPPMGDAGVDAGSDGGFEGPLGMWLRVGDETPVQVYDVEVDSATYAEVVERLGAAPEGLIDAGPTEDGARRVKPRVSAGDPTELFELVARLERDEAFGGAGLDILIGGGGAQAIGLLLPAVQKVRAISVEQSASSRGTALSFHFDGPIEIAEVTTEPMAVETEPAPPPFYDVDGVVSHVAPGLGAAEAGRLEGLEGTHFVLEGDLELTRNGEDLEGALVAGFAEADRDAIQSWAGTGADASIALDVRGEGGAVLQRIRIPRASATPPTADYDVGTRPAAQIFIKVLHLQPQAEDPSHEAMLSDTYHESYDDTDLTTAISRLRALPSLDPADPTASADALRAYWSDGVPGAAGAQRDATIEDLSAGAVFAADQEGSLCTTAMPLVARIARQLDAAIEAGTIAPSPELHSALADAYEGYVTLGEPSRYAFVGGELESSDVEAADAEMACRAAMSLHRQRYQHVDFEAAVPDADWTLLAEANEAMNATDSRHADWIIIQLVETLDSIADGTATDLAAAIGRAGALQDELRDVLLAETDHAQARWVMKEVLVTSYR